MSDSVDRVFVHALNTVKRIPRTGTARPPAAERLKLYGLYKQSMEGDVEGVMDRPVGNTADVYMECEKWDAWFAQRGVSRTEAKRRYISTLVETMHTYASQTAEARELVAELEFVWDQVKTNISSSSVSSPVQSTGIPPIPQTQSYGSIGSQLAHHPEYQHLVSTARGDSRLRVLSPVSQPDEIYQRRAARDGYEHEEGQRQAVDDEDELPLDEDEEEEEYAEAQANIYEDERGEEIGIDEEEDHQQGYTNQIPAEDSRRRKRNRTRIPYGNDHHTPDPGPIPEANTVHQGGMLMQQNKDDVDSRRWRRRVEQALTKMTAEIAAAREQMEARTIAARRRSGVWAWLRWLVWVTLRQIIWDLAFLGMLLIWMRLRRDQRLEEQLKAGWSVVKGKLMGLKALKGMKRVYIFS
ncbi:acyl CoA binding protein-domain-containing protein [Aspergillus karnatakaensis]|uniref:acyl CoA binding protein-domain-containing protein n=1 Tax=Aspergillus karnatakaensis TaxID=1810916 RepID=UPI003CCD5D14